MRGVGHASLNLFTTLTDELDADIEFRQDGGMLVAETDEQLELIDSKGKLAARPTRESRMVPTRC